MVASKVLKPKQTREVATASDAYPDKEAQARFERAVDAALATPPVHKVASKKLGAKNR